MIESTSISILTFHHTRGLYASHSDNFGHFFDSYRRVSDLSSQCVSQNHSSTDEEADSNSSSHISAPFFLPLVGLFGISLLSFSATQLVSF